MTPRAPFFQTPPSLGNQWTDDAVLRSLVTRLLAKPAVVAATCDGNGGDLDKNDVLRHVSRDLEAFGETTAALVSGASDF
jgi:hypothetical protein